MSEQQSISDAVLLAEIGLALEGGMIPPRRRAALLERAQELLGAAAECERLRVRVGELERDAARYRAIRPKLFVGSWLVGRTGGPAAQCVAMDLWYVPRSCAVVDVDAAIDAARAQATTEEGET